MYCDPHLTGITQAALKEIEDQQESLRQEMDRVIELQQTVAVIDVAAQYPGSATTAEGRWFCVTCSANHQDVPNLHRLTFGACHRSGLLLSNGGIAPDTATGPDGWKADFKRVMNQHWNSLTHRLCTQHMEEQKKLMAIDEAFGAQTVRHFFP